MLSISVHTVNTHRQRILEKLRVGTSIEAIKYAAAAGPYVACRLSKSPSGGVDGIRRIDAGANAGLDFELGRFVIGVEAEYGLVRLSGGADKFHNINYSLMLGYRFGGK